MANEAIKDIVQDLRLKISSSVSPDSIMQDLFSKKVISEDDYNRLLQVTDSVDRCREMLLLLHETQHQQAFIYLRLALLDEYSGIVDEIDDKISSLICPLQQLDRPRPGYGKLSLTFHSHRLFVINCDIHFVHLYLYIINVLSCLTSCVNSLIMVNILLYCSL